MASNGKLEARITVPTGGWAFAITEVPANTATITVPAGTYYHSTADSEDEGLAETVATLIAAAVTATDLAGTYTVAIGAGENGTGKYTITATGITSFSIAWTSSVLQALLGFTTAPSGALTYTGENHCQGLWLPSYGHQKLNGGVGGGWITDGQSYINSTGRVGGVMGQRYRHTRIRWSQEKRNKTWVENEATGMHNESFEAFLIDGIWGEAAWGTYTGPIRFYPDAGDDAAYGSFGVPKLKDWEPASMVEHWTGRWVIDLPQLIEVPGSNLGARAPVADEVEPEGPVNTTIDTILPSDIFAQIGLTPTWMVRGSDASGATELVSGTDNLTDTGTPTKEVVSALLGGLSTTIANGSTDALDAASAAVNDITTEAFAIMWIGAPIAGGGLGNLVGKRDSSAPNNGYELLKNGSTDIQWICDSASGGTTRLASINLTGAAQVILATRKSAADEQNLYVQGLSVTGSRLNESITSATIFTIGQGALRSAGGQEFGACLIFTGADAEAINDSHRLLVAQMLGYEA